MIGPDMLSIFTIGDLRSIDTERIHSGDNLVPS